MTRKAGRPPKFTERLAKQVCQRMADGESLRQVCRDPKMPSLKTVMRWAADNPTFRQQYAEAREALLEHWAEEITEIADDGSNDWIRREKEAGVITEVPDHEHINRSRLRVDTRKWLLSKLAPRKYGDALALTHANPDGSHLQAPTFAITFPGGGPGLPPNDSSADKSDGDSDDDGAGTTGAETS